MDHCQLFLPFDNLVLLLVSLSPAIVNLVFMRSSQHWKRSWRVSHLNSMVPSFGHLLWTRQTFSRFPHGLSLNQKKKTASVSAVLCPNWMWPRSPVVRPGPNWGDSCSSCGGTGELASCWGHCRRRLPPPGARGGGLGEQEEEVQVEEQEEEEEEEQERGEDPAPGCSTARPPPQVPTLTTTTRGWTKIFNHNLCEQPRIFKYVS